MKQLLLSVDFLHKRGLIHRDLKPQNVLLVNEAKNHNYEVKLADFGLSHFQEDFERATRKCGSPGYIAPEIIKNRICDSKSDIFSLGSIFYNLLTARTLFPADSVKGVL